MKKDWELEGKMIQMIILIQDMIIPRKIQFLAVLDMEMAIKIRIMALVLEEKMMDLDMKTEMMVLDMAKVGMIDMAAERVIHFHHFLDNRQKLY